MSKLENNIYEINDDVMVCKLCSVFALLKITLHYIEIKNKKQTNLVCILRIKLFCERDFIT